MVDKQIGSKPEYTCGWKMDKKLVFGAWVKTKFWKCTTKHTPIIITVPEIHQKKIELISKIPKITFSDKSLIFNTPEVTIEMKLIKFNSLVLTSIDYDDVENQTDETAGKIEQKQGQLDSLVSSFDTQLHQLQIQLINEEFDKAEANIRSEAKETHDKYSGGIENCKETIRDLKNNNAKEALKKEEDKLNNLIQEMNRVLGPINTVLKEISEARNKAIDDIEGGNE
jgi:hypothetical protein